MKQIILDETFYIPQYLGISNGWIDTMPSSSIKTAVRELKMLKHKRKRLIAHEIK